MKSKVLKYSQCFFLFFYFIFCSLRIETTKAICENAGKVFLLNISVLFPHRLHFGVAISPNESFSQVSDLELSAVCFNAFIRRRPLLRLPSVWAAPFRTWLKGLYGEATACLACGQGAGAFRSSRVKNSHKVAI